MPIFSRQCRQPNWDYYGGTVGLDYQIQPNILLGAAAGGNDSNFAVSARTTSGDSTGFHAGVYGVEAFGHWYAEESASFSTFSNTTKRNGAAFGGLSSSQERATFGSVDLGGRIEGVRILDYGKSYGFTNLKVTPFVAMELAELRTDPFSEYAINGGGDIVGLSGRSRSTVDLPTSVGMRFESIYTVASGIEYSPDRQRGLRASIRPAAKPAEWFRFTTGFELLIPGAQASSNAFKT